MICSQREQKYDLFVKYRSGTWPPDSRHMNRRIAWKIVNQSMSALSVVLNRGFEPQFPGSEPSVLPLNESRVEPSGFEPLLSVRETDVLPLNDGSEGRIGFASYGSFLTAPVHRTRFELAHTALKAPLPTLLAYRCIGSRHDALPG